MLVDPLEIPQIGGGANGKKQEKWNKKRIEILILIINCKGYLLYIGGGVIPFWLFKIYNLFRHSIKDGSVYCRFKIFKIQNLGEGINVRMLKVNWMSKSRIVYSIDVKAVS